MRLSLLCLVLGACGSTCYQMSAPDLVELELERDLWPPGVYEIELSGFDEVAMCVVTLPAADGELVSCTSGAVLVLDSDGISSMEVEDFAPPSFVVEVLQDGALLADEHFEPDYVVDEPNGEGCGERSRATVALTL